MAQGELQMIINFEDYMETIYESDRTAKENVERFGLENKTVLIGNGHLDNPDDMADKDLLREQYLYSLTDPRRI
jgi:hypothetical protein